MENMQAIAVKFSNFFLVICRKIKQQIFQQNTIIILFLERNHFLGSVGEGQTEVCQMNAKEQPILLGGQIIKHNFSANRIITYNILHICICMSYMR